MAHGYRHVPERRTAIAPAYDCCTFCAARLDIGMRPHLCKEMTYGTPATATSILPPLPIPARLTTVGPPG